MKFSLTVFSAGIIACAIAQEPTSPPEPGARAEPASGAEKIPPTPATYSPGLRGKLEITVNGQKSIIDLSQNGKELIETEVAGKTDTRVMDSAEVDALTRSLFAGEKMPLREGPMTYLGVATTEVPREVAAQLPLPPDTGLLVAGIAPDSPAAKAGVMESDVLIMLDDQIIITTRQLAVLIANRKKDEGVKITFFRKGQQGQLTAVLSEREAPPPVSTANPLARITRYALVLGPDGKVIRRPSDEELKALPEHVRQQLMEVIKQHQNSQPQAAAPAKTENKKP